MVRRIFRLFLIYARMDMLWLLKDFRNFALCTLTDVIINMASVTGVWMIAERFAGIGQMGRYHILFMLGYSMTVNGVLNTFFNFNIGHISRRIGRGQLEHMLMQPNPLWMSLLTEGFVPLSGSGVLLSGCVLLVWALYKLVWPVNAVFILVLMVSILLSVLISLSYSFLWGSLAFYAPVAAEEVCTSIMDLFGTLRNFPLGGIGLFSRVLMLSILPVGLSAWYPAVSLLSGGTLRGIAFLLSMTIFFVTTTIIVFRKGLQHYAAKGNYRYHDRGHRR